MTCKTCTVDGHGKPSTRKYKLLEEAVVRGTQLLEPILKRWSSQGEAENGRAPIFLRNTCARSTLHLGCLNQVN